MPGHHRLEKNPGGKENFHCAASPCRMNGAEWVNHFIPRILHIFQGQWVLQNFTLHDQTRGYLRLQERQQVLEEIDRLADEDPSNIPQESRFLLEVDFRSLLRSFFERQSYWVMVMKAACFSIITWSASVPTVLDVRLSPVRRLRASLA